MLVSDAALPVSSTASPSASPSASSNHTGVIAGGVVGGLALVGLLGALAWLLLRRSRSAAGYNIVAGGAIAAPGYAVVDHKPPSDVYAHTVPWQHSELSAERVVGELDGHGAAGYVKPAELPAGT